MAEAKRLDHIYQYSKIFLACDELETIELFQKTFGERLIFCEAHRVSAASYNTVHYTHNDACVLRDHHKYRLGQEVLIDALLLARTGHLLCGPSNVSFGAIYFAEKEQIIHEMESPGFFHSP